jgi:hypothetical protein
MEKSQGPTPEPEYPDPPTGIWIICGLGLIGAVLSLLAAPLYFAEGSAVVGVILVAFSLVQLAVLWGLLLLRPWAYQVAMVLYAVGGFVDLLAGAILGAIVSFLVLGYVASVYSDVKAGKWKTDD